MPPEPPPLEQAPPVDGVEMVPQVRASRPLMFDQQAKEWALSRQYSAEGIKRDDSKYGMIADWKQGHPPTPGHYLVTVQTDEGPPFVRLERWDGRAWVTAGGYVTVRAWDWLPEAWRGG